MYVYIFAQGIWTITKYKGVTYYARPWYKLTVMRVSVRSNNEDA